LGARLPVPYRVATEVIVGRHYGKRPTLAYRATSLSHFCGSSVNRNTLLIILL
jgi:hypothetical protein